MRFVGFSFRRSERKPDLRIAYIESVEKRLTMDERSVIDVERYLADNGKCVFAILVIENPYISCDQAPKRVQREAANVGFDTAFV